MTDQPDRKLKIGLTGGIGSGKTAVADMLAELGAAIIDTDAIAHALTAPGGEAIEPVRAAFGDAVIKEDGSLDRAAMRKIVFADSEQRVRLESILHPLIGQAVERAAEETEGLYQVFVVPLLVESGRWVDRVDRVCVVDCEPETQIARVKERSGLTRDQIEQIISVQAMRDERLALADDVVNNGAQTDLEDLRKQVLVLHDQWCNLRP